MDDIFDFSENVIRLRKSKGITQEQLAEFLGVTKASVSKWETGQSLPDITLLPVISSYFDVTIDEILGYHPKLSQEEINKIYEKLCGKFANEPFEDVFAESEKLVKQYYTCYPFLFMISVLWLNHYMLSEGVELQMEILNKASELCVRILDNERDRALCNKALIVNAQILLLLGKYQETIELIEDIANPFSPITQSQGMLVQAYQAMGDIKKAEENIQVMIINGIMNTISSSTLYLANNPENLEKNRETIRRTEELIDIYNVVQVHANTAALFYIQAAICYGMHGLKEDCIDILKKYVDCIMVMFEKELICIHSDGYFDKLESVVVNRKETGPVPRDKKVIFASALSVFEYPVLAVYKEEKDFIALKQKLERKGEELCLI